MVLAIAALRRTDARPLVVGAILAVAKPQYAALPGLAVAAVLAQRRAWRALLVVAAALLVMAIVLLAVGVLASVVAVWSATREQRDEVLVRAALALGVVLTPYALIYEHALLLPALVSAASAADRCGPRARAAILTGLVLLCALAWGTFIFSKLFATHALLGFVPVATVALFGAAHLAARRFPAGTAATSDR